MSNRDGPEDAMGWMIIAGIAMAAMALLFVGVLIALVLTLVCFWAWNEEREVFGEKITPQEARTFVACGVVGGVICGVLGAITDANSTGENVAGWFAIGGYMFGSLGYAGLLGMQHEREEKERALQAEERRYVQMHQSPPAREARGPLRSFDYASWDDEETRH